MEKKVDKRAEQNADALKRNIDQQVNDAPTDPPAQDGTKRRTWEGYAKDYRDLSEELVEVSRRQQESLAQIEALDGQLRRVNAQRLKDLDRLAAVSRTRDLLEKRAAAQMAKVAAASARPGATPASGAVYQSASVNGQSASLPHGVGQGSNRGEANSFAARVEEQPAVALGWSDRRWWQRTVAIAQKAHREQRLGDAQLYFEVALLTRQTSSLWEQLGHVLRESGHYLDGEVAYRRALRSRPDHAELLFLSGYCLEMAGAASSAVPFYSSALDRDPKLVERYPQLQDFRARLGQ